MFSLENLRKFYSGKGSRVFCVGLQRDDFESFNANLKHISPDTNVSYCTSFSDLTKICDESYFGVLIIVSDLAYIHKHTKDVSTIVAIEHFLFFGYSKNLLNDSSDCSDPQEDIFISCSSSISDLATSVARICLYSESRPFWSHLDFHNRISELSLDNNAHSISSSYSVINGKITRPSLVSVLDPSWFKSNSYYRSLNDDIIGIYNIFDNSIEYLDNNRSHQKAECLYIINPLEYPLDPANLPLDAIKKYNPNISFEFVGLFSSNTNSYCGEALVGDALILL